MNHPLGKNLIGAFHQPSLVAIDPALLETLPRREFRAGLYKVIKYGVTSSRDLFERIDREIDAIFARKAEALVPIIGESCTIKATVVGLDERESGPRRMLNFGHTAGHALEAVTSTNASVTAKPSRTECSWLPKWRSRAAPCRTPIARRWGRYHEARPASACR